MDHAAAHAEQAAVSVEGDFEVPVLVALLDGGEEMLAPVLDPFDRPAQHQAGGGKRHLLRIHHELGAEAAADIGRHDADLVLVESEQLHQERAHLVRELRRRPQRQPILVGVVGGERAAALDRVGAAAMLLESDTDAMRRARERVRDIAVGLPELEQEIARSAAMGARRVRARAPAGSPTRPAAARSRPRPARRRPRRRSGVSAITTATASPTKATSSLASTNGVMSGGNCAVRNCSGRRSCGQERRKIGEREHRVDAGATRAPRASMPRIAAWACGLRTKAASQHAGKVQVVDEAAAAGEQRAVLDPRDRGADASSFRHAFAPAAAIVMETPNGCKNQPVKSSWNV